MKAIAIKVSVISTLVIFGAMFAMLAIGSGIAAKYVDVSTEPAYRKFVGARYELRVPMHLSGVNAPRGYERTIDYYTLNPATPSWTGPELITRRTLPSGTMVAVKSVRRCRNCPFDSRVEALVQIDGVDIDSRFSVSISLGHLAPSFAREVAKKPNQPSEPTPTSVTTPAAQEIAPAAVVAHL